MKLILTGESYRVVDGVDLDELPVSVKRTRVDATEGKAERVDGHLVREAGSSTHHLWVTLRVMTSKHVPRL